MFAYLRYEEVVFAKAILSELRVALRYPRFRGHLVRRHLELVRV
jgi:hypothetical protein